MVDFELWILDSFSIFLRFEISENFSYDDRVIEVSMVEVHIGQEILIERAEKRRHIGFLPSSVLQQNDGSSNGATGEVVEIDCGNILTLALSEEAF